MCLRSSGKANSIVGFATPRMSRPLRFAGTSHDRMVGCVEQTLGVINAY
jgi:hypothetical protein